MELIIVFIIIYSKQSVRGYMTSASSPTTPTRPPIIPERTTTTILQIKQQIAATPKTGFVAVPPSLTERIAAAVRACFTAQEPESTLEGTVRQIKSEIREACTTTFRIQLYVKFQSFFHPILKLLGSAPSIESLNQQSYSLQTAKRQAEVISQHLKGGDDPTTVSLKEANERLLTSLDSAIAEVDKALIEAYKDRYGNIEHEIAKLTERYESANIASWLSTGDYEKKLAALTQKLHDTPPVATETKATQRAINDLVFLLKKKPPTGTKPEIPKTTQTRRIESMERMFSTLLPEGFNFKGVPSDRLDAIAAEHRRSKNAELSIDHQMQFLEIFSTHNQPVVAQELETRILDRIESSLSTWTKAEDAMFSKDLLSQTNWASEYSYRNREAPLKSALEKLKARDSAKSRATELLSRIDRYQADSEYRDKKTSLNFNLLKPMLEQMGALSQNPAKAMENMDVEDCLKWAMQQPDLNDRIETIIERHLPPGVNELQNALSPSEISDIISVLAIAKNRLSPDPFMTGRQPFNHEFSNAIAQLRKARTAKIDVMFAEVQAAKQATAELMEKALEVLQDILGPYHTLPPETEEALKTALSYPDIFQDIVAIIKEARTEQAAVKEWFKTDTSQPLTTELDLQEFTDHTVQQPKLRPLFHQLMSVFPAMLRAKTGVFINTQLVTDSMLLNVFSAEELSTGTAGRHATTLERTKKLGRESKLDPLGAHLAPQDFFHVEDYNLWFNSTWQKKTANSDSLQGLAPSFTWQGQMAIPAPNQSMRLLKTPLLTLDFARLGSLSDSEQRYAFAFIKNWCDIRETVDPALTRSDSREKWRIPLQTRDPAAIPQIAPYPSKTSLRTFLLDDQTYWDAVDEPQKRDDIHDFDKKNEAVLKRYSELVAMASEFQTALDREILRALVTIGSEDTLAQPVPSAKDSPGKPTTS